MKRLFRRSLHVICLIISACVLCNCTRDAFEDERPNFKDDPYITLTVATPGMDVPETRAIAETDENYLTEVDVLVFRMVGDKEIFHYMTHGTNLGAIAPQRTFKVKLRVSDMVDGVAESHRFVVVANLRDELDAAATAGVFVEGRTKAEVLAAIQFSATGKWNTTSSGDFTPLPMWGESAKMHPVNDKLQSSTIGTIALVRAIARIDVGLNFESDAPDALPQGLPDFKISDVYVYNTMSKGVAAPLSTNFDATDKTATKPTIPIGAVRAENPIIYTHTPADNGMVREIYIAESSNNDSALANDEITCLVVGGHYKASATKTYYRIDFYEKQAQDENGPQVELDILRNHRYKVNITAVTGPGYEDPDDAVNSVPVNMKSEILTWDEGEMDDITFDGHYYFGITARDIVFSPVAPASEVIKIKSNVPDLALWLDNSIKLQAGTGGEKTYTNNSLGFKYELEDMGSNKYTLTITSSEHNISMTPTDRKEEFTFHAKRLRVPFTTKQTGTEVYISLENDGTSAFLPEGTQLTDSLPLRILSSQPVTVTVDDGKTTKSALSWVTDYKDASLVDGLYEANFNFNIGLYTGAYGSSTDLRRRATVTIEPETTKKFAVTYHITQQRPYILFSENLITFQRTPANQGFHKVTIQTNVPRGSLKVSKGTVTGGDKFTIGDLIYGNDDTRPRVPQIYVIANRETAPDDGNIVATNYIVSADNDPKVDYEVDALLVASFQAIVLRFGWGWNFGVDDQGLDYIFPWNTDSDAGKNIPGYVPAQIVVNTNDKGIEWVKTHSSAINTKSVDIGELTPTGDGSLGLVTFGLDAKNWNEVIQPFRVYLKGSTYVDSEATSIMFGRGAQVFSDAGSSSFPDVGSLGIAQAEGRTSLARGLTSNVEWSATSDANWLTFKYGVDGTWSKTITQNDKFYAPVLNSAELQRSDSLYMAVTPFTTINASPRQARVQFTNNSRSIDPDKLGAPDPAEIVITQNSLVLKYQKSCADHNGGISFFGWGDVTYDIFCETNIPDYTVKAVDAQTGARILLTGITKTSSGVISEADSPVQSTISFVLPHILPPLTSRRVTFYLVAPNRPSAGLDTNIESFTMTQELGIDMTQSVPGVVSIDDKGVLNVDGRGKALFFKRGSLVGITQVNVCVSMAHRILFNPIENSPSYAEDIVGIPYGSLSSSDNFKGGYGDICRFLGLTAEMMQTMSESELNAYDSEHRIMRQQDFQKLFGVTNPVSGAISNRDYVWYSGSVLDNTMPMGIVTYEGVKYYLPAYGEFDFYMHYSEGVLSRFWIPEIIGGFMGGFMSFDRRILTTGRVQPFGIDDAEGFFLPVRCIRK